MTISGVRTSTGYDLTVAFGGAIMDAPSAISKGLIKAGLSIELGGADSGTVKATGPANTKEFALGDPMTMDDLSAAYTPGATGEVTLTPDVLLIELAQTGSVVATCTPTGAVDASLTLDVADEGGTSGTTGGDTSGTSSGTSGTGSSGSTSGGLAQTGATGHGAVIAVAFLGGTVLLVGAGIFTFMPGNRARTSAPR
jgi:hypothetical protein